jgi:hypothetical protein
MLVTFSAQRHNQIARWLRLSQAAAPLPRLSIRYLCVRTGNLPSTGAIGSVYDEVPEAFLEGCGVGTSIASWPKKSRARKKPENPSGACSALGEALELAGKYYVIEIILELST